MEATQAPLDICLDIAPGQPWSRRPGPEDATSLCLPALSAAWVGSGSWLGSSLHPGYSSCLLDTLCKAAQRSYSDLGRSCHPENEVQYPHQSLLPWSLPCSPTCHGGVFAPGWQLSDITSMRLFWTSLPSPLPPHLLLTASSVLLLTPPTKTAALQGKSLILVPILPKAHAAHKPTGKNELRGMNPNQRQPQKEPGGRPKSPQY